MTNKQTSKISDNFKLMCITSTKMIAHDFVNFDLIQTSFKRLSVYSLDSVGKKFQGHSISDCAGRWAKEL